MWWQWWQWWSLISNLHFKSLTRASLWASHHSGIVDQNVNLGKLIRKTYQRAQISWKSISKSGPQFDVKARYRNKNLGEGPWDLLAALLHTPQAAQVQPAQISSSKFWLLLVKMTRWLPTTTWTPWPPPWSPPWSPGQLLHPFPGSGRGARHGRLSCSRRDDQ